MRPYLSLIDTATKGRYDATPLFSDRVAFAQLVHDLLAPFSGVAFDLVADDLDRDRGTNVWCRSARAARGRGDRWRSSDKY